MNCYPWEQLAMVLGDGLLRGWSGWLDTVSVLLHQHRVWFGAKTHLALAGYDGERPSQSQRSHVQHFSGMRSHVCPQAMHRLVDFCFLG